MDCLTGGPVTVARSQPVRRAAPSVGTSAPSRRSDDVEAVCPVGGT